MFEEQSKQRMIFVVLAEKKILSSVEHNLENKG